MEKLTPCAAIALPTERCTRYRGLAYDGFCFYVSMPTASCVYVLDRGFQEVCLMDVPRPYARICYDSAEACFWASTDNTYGELFKLDMCFKEMDSVWIGGHNKVTMKVTGLSYDCVENALLVSCADFVARVSKSGRITRILKRAQGACFASVLGMAPYFAVVYASGAEQNMDVFSEDGRLVRRHLLPPAHVVDALVLSSSVNRGDAVLDLVALATERGG
jgi:hypothetical protein